MEKVEGPKAEEKVRAWLKDKHNFLLLLLIIATIVIRIYYFFLTSHQPIWWDEGDYLSIAKTFAFGLPKPEWWGHFTIIRPLLLPLIWAAIFKIGLGEITIRLFTLVIPGIFSVYALYLLGKELYDKTIGLIAAFMLSLYWSYMFYTYRFLTDIPAILFGILAAYFFWGEYIKKQKPRGLYLAAFFGVAAFSSRFPLALVLVTCAIYLIFIKKSKVFKDKTIWKGLAYTLLFLSPYIIFFIHNKFQLLTFYFGAGSGTANDPYAWYVITLFGSLFHTAWLASFIIGLASLYGLVINFDIVWKQKSDKLNADLFLVIWLVLNLIFYIALIRAGTDRWLFILMPAAFIIAGKGLMTLKKFLSKYDSSLAIIVVLLLLFAGAYQNLIHANSLILEKKDSYKELRDSGEWLKENTPKDTEIITASIVQHFYYSERQTYDYNYNETLLPKDCKDRFGSLVVNQTCQEASEHLFEIKRQIVKPGYMIVSVFEPVFTPQWAYTYPSRNNLTLVNVYPSSSGQPMLIVYKF